MPPLLIDPLPSLLFVAAFILLTNALFPIRDRTRLLRVAIFWVAINTIWEILQRASQSAATPWPSFLVGTGDGLDVIAGLLGGLIVAVFILLKFDDAHSSVPLRNTNQSRAWRYGMHTILLASAVFSLTATSGGYAGVGYDYKPVFLSYKELRSSFKVDEPRDIKTNGKIYTVGTYLLVNEVNTGIHVIANSDPRAPQKKAFLNIPGNIDMAVKGNVLYADSYVDLLAIELAASGEIKLIKRIENIFPNTSFETNGYYHFDESINPEKGILIGVEKTRRAHHD